MVLIFDIKSIGVQQVGVGEKGVSLIIIIVCFFFGSGVYQRIAS